MSFLKRFYRRKSTSVILADLYSRAGADKLVLELEKLARVPAPLLTAIEKGGTAICFVQPRKGTLLHVIPRLIENAIPATLLFDPNRVGLNQLTPDDELTIYRLAHPRGILSNDAEAIRRELGPLPFNRLDPLIFPAMWRDIAKCSSPLISLGWHGPIGDDVLAGVAMIGRLGGGLATVVLGNVSGEIAQLLKLKGISNLTIVGESEIAGDGGSELSYRRMIEGISLWPE